MWSRKGNNQVATNPNKLKRAKNKDNLFNKERGVKPERNYRWSSIEDQFVERDNKFTKETDKARAERTDYEPLYSSFSPGNAFMPPPTSAEVLNHQKELLHKTSISEALTNKSRGGLRATTAIPVEESLMGTGNNSTNLFARVGTVEGSPSRINTKTFKNSTYKGIRAGAFKNL